MLLTVEKVLILSSIDIFSEIPGHVLADVATALEEVEVSAGAKIIKKGDLGTSMYIIVSGEARVHDGDKEFAKLGEHDVFGELAALDPEHRSADVTVIKDTVLLKMENEELLDIVAGSVDVARGIIRFLCRRVRNTVC